MGDLLWNADVPEFVGGPGSFKDWFAGVCDVDCVCFCNGDFVRGEDCSAVIVTCLTNREEGGLDAGYPVAFGGGC